MDIQKYWKCTLEQNAEEMKTYFRQAAYVNWHNTNEHFTVDEFIRANCEYPGEWDGEIERIENIDEHLIITVVHVFSVKDRLSFHVTSFIKLKDDLIEAIDEYWGEDGDAPQWRQEKNIGTAIQQRKQPSI